MVDPTYVSVRERQKRITVAMTRRSEHPLLCVCGPLPDLTKCPEFQRSVQSSFALATPKPCQLTSCLTAGRTGWPSRYSGRLEKAGNRSRAGKQLTFRILLHWTGTARYWTSDIPSLLDAAFGSRVGMARRRFSRPSYLWEGSGAHRTSRLWDSMANRVTSRLPHALHLNGPP